MKISVSDCSVEYLHEVMTLVTVIAVVLAATVRVSRAGVHSWGELIEYHHHHMDERTLIDDTNSVPKDYTIFYKYHGSPYKQVAYIEINVNTKSQGDIQLTKDRKEWSYGRIETRQTFDGQVYIKNALNVRATLKIRGLGMLPMRSVGRSNKLDTKSIAYVHVKNSSPSLTQKKFAQNSIGKRRAGDKLIHFESKNVRNQNRFPSRAFEYSGEEFITYVGFSFDSPTAMVMVNTTYVGEQEFNAVVYDMNCEHFIANMSVYGIQSSLWSYKFQGVI